MEKYYDKKYSSFVGSDYGIIGIRNRYRVNLFTKLINPKKNERVLEIGCNKGVLLLNLAKYSKHVIGIDINKCYSSCIYDPYDNWIKYSVEDTWEDYDGELKTGLYYVETDDLTLLHQTNIYSN